MTEYRIFETDGFKKDLRLISEGPLPKIDIKLKEYMYPQIKKEPHFGPHIKKLKGYEPATWRYRVGGWRFFYEIDETRKIVCMTVAESRGSAY